MRNDSISKDIDFTPLTREEKNAMRAHIFMFVEAHPISQSATHRKTRLSVFLLQPFRMAMASFILVLLIGSGISYAAEGALPGNLLYPMKVEFNERIRAWTAVSDEAHATWTVNRATRRLREAEQLLAVGQLDAATQKELEARIEKQTSDAKETIARLKARERIDVAADASSRLESTLRIHEHILTQVAEDRQDVRAQVHSMLEQVREKVESAAEMRSVIEDEIASSTIDRSASIEFPARKKQQEAEEQWKIMQASLDTYRLTLNETAAEEVTKLLDGARDIITIGNDFLKQSDYGKAFSSFQKAIRIEEEARLLMEARDKLQIQVKLDSILPTLSDTIHDARKGGQATTSKQNGETEHPVEEKD